MILHKVCMTLHLANTAGVADCRAKGDVVFILDSSGSVGQENFYRLVT